MQRRLKNRLNINRTVANQNGGGELGWGVLSYNQLQGPVRSCTNKR